MTAAFLLNEVKTQPRFKPKGEKSVKVYESRKK